VDVALLPKPGTGLTALDLADLVAPIEGAVGHPVHLGELSTRSLIYASDPATGRFTWAPPAGYLGDSALVFVHGEAQVRVTVTIRPGVHAGAGGKALRES
jgi:hypothetical protein